MKKGQYDKGLKKRQKVLGIKYVNQTIKNKNLFNEDFQDFITINCWDKVWKTQIFSSWFTNILHTYPGEGIFEKKKKHNILRKLFNSDIEKKQLANNYLGKY